MYSFCSNDDLSSVFLIIQINRGMVIYICFFKGATEDIIPKMGMQFLFPFAIKHTVWINSEYNI